MTVPNPPTPDKDGRTLPPPRTLRERLGALKNLGPFLRLIWQASPRLAGLDVALRAARAVLPIALLYVGKLIVDEVIAVAALPDPPADVAGWIASGRLATLVTLVGVELGLAVLSDALGRGVSLVEGLLSERATNLTSVRLMQHATTLDLAHFEDPEIQDGLDRARRQTVGRMTLMTQVLGQAQDLVTIVAFSAGLLVYAPWLIALLALALVPAFIGELHFNALDYSLTYAWTPERRELEYIRQTGASVETAKEVKIFGLHDFLVERYATLADGLYRANKRLATRRALWGGLLTAIGTLGYYAAYVIIIFETVRGAFSIGDLGFLAGSFLRLRNLLEGLLAGFSAIAGQALYLDDLFSFFAVRPKITSPERPLPFPDPIREGFVFEDVGFRYPGSQAWALRHVSFRLGADEVLALVGENGSGKTTLVKLLARLYDPDEGRILLDGHDIKAYALDDLRDAIGVIFQDFVRYHLTAGENIAVGQIDKRLDQARIEAAAMHGQADQVIAKLPLGYDHMMGKKFRKGAELSGGEWQKIALARAYMADAQVMILDEPTAALDARAEAMVFQRFRELAEARAAIVISHRFSTVRMADRIVVLADGRVEDIGTHAELMARGGRYAELFEIQAAGYR
ncbi:MAG: ABC transporter ATP-binding protein [Deltaproteobacteria bacterium]|nr:ABC transporter ATP-binding protein [Deltaproteobacteria bacterium]